MSRQGIGFSRKWALLRGGSGKMNSFLCFSHFWFDLATCFSSTSNVNSHRNFRYPTFASNVNREPRTKTQDQTRIHSDIRRAARSYLRHRALVLDTPGPGSMTLAVRRVCAIRIQRWFLHQAAFYRKMWTSITGFQALARGHLQRKRYEKVLEQQSRPKVVKNRPLDAFTAVIRIQAWVRSTIIRRAYVHEHRLRASYTDIQWDKRRRVLETVFLH